jgi:Xaa-Pro dipeptidase
MAGNTAVRSQGSWWEQFPHERIPGDQITLYVHPKNPGRMRDLGSDGQPRPWILGIHFVDRARKIGGVYERLLTVD